MSNLSNQIQAPSAIRSWARAALITAPLMAFALMIAAPAANADGYRGGHYDRGFDRSYDRRHQRRSHRRNHRQNQARYYSRYSPRYRGYNRYNRYNRYSRNDRRGAYLIGGLVVGSLITHAITNNRNNYRDERHTTRVYDRSNSYSTYNSSGRDASREREAPVSRRLFRDAQGNCFERQTGPDNQELLIDLPAEECRW